MLITLLQMELHTYSGPFLFYCCFFCSLTLAFLLSSNLPLPTDFRLYYDRFNEPDLSSQANLSPSLAANLWVQYMLPLKWQHPNVKLISPAITNGEIQGMGINWMQEFVNDCETEVGKGNCEIDAYAVSSTCSLSLFLVDDFWLTFFLAFEDALVRSLLGKTIELSSKLEVFIDIDYLNRLQRTSNNILLQLIQSYKNLFGLLRYILSFFLALLHQQYS